MNSIPSVFSFKSSEVRTVILNNEPWFIASDVCSVLGMKNHREAIRHLDEDERGVISNDTPSSNQHGSFGTVKQEVSIINESGLYALVLRSRKPEAKPFIKWVTKEVLPAIRKTGQYIAAPYSVNASDTLTKEQQDALRNLLTESAKQRFPEDTKKQGAFIMRGWSKMKAHFKVGYREIPAIEFTEALSIATRHAVEGDYLPARETEPLQLNDEDRASAAWKELTKHDMILSFGPNSEKPHPIMYPIPEGSFFIRPDDFAKYIGDPGGRITLAMLPCIIASAANRLAGAHRLAA